MCWLFGGAGADGVNIGSAAESTGVVGVNAGA